MPQIKIEEVIDHLDYEMKRALRATSEKHFLNQDFETRAVFETFK